MLNIKLLTAAGREPRVHPNGFIQLDLTDTGNSRLHVWPEKPLDAQRSHWYHQVHDHRFLLVSRVILGHMENIIYAFTPDTSGSHEVWEARYPRGRHDTLLENTRVRGTLQAHRVESHSPSLRPQYSVPPFVLHATFPHGMCATIMESSPAANKKIYPRVIVPVGVKVDNKFTRFAYREDVLWGVIEEAVRRMGLLEVQEKLIA